MSKLNHIYITLFFTIFLGNMKAQEGEKSYQFLNLPTSAHTSALGGTNISVIDNDVSSVFQNPAALGSEMNMNLSMSYMSYLSGIGQGNIIFGKALSDISSFAGGVNYLDYGKFRGTTAEDQSTGDFTAKDIALNAVYSRDLTENLRGGVTTKFIYSAYDVYTSTAIGFDVGLSYCEKTEIQGKEVYAFSAGLVIKNIGTQLSSYNSEKVRLPWDVQIGATKRLSKAPIQFSLTAMYLTQWNFSKINAENGIDTSNDSFLNTAFKHLVMGADIFPSDNMWISLGYNPKVHADMALQTGNVMGGLSMGAGIHVNKFKIGASVSSYTKSATSYLFSVAMDLRKY